MCGICGFSWDDRKLIRGMCNTLKHRGPDDSGYYNDRYVSLGHSRLKIIDLSSKGRQPISNENKDIWIVYNGELYNYQELKEELVKKGHRFYTGTDTEVIVHAYEEYGTDCLRRFNGIFAFAVYDTNKKIIFLARDFIGVKPLYYYYDDKKFIFASEIKAILESDGVQRKINTKALDQYFALRYIWGEHTIFEKIFRLGPAEYVVYNLKTNQLAKEKYWAADPGIQLPDSRKALSAKLRNLLEDAVRRQLMSDVPLGAYLSGGIDSSTIVALMRKINPNGEIKTFSVEFEDDPEHSETKYARIVSELFQCDHHELVVRPTITDILPKIAWHLDEPFADPTVVPVYLLSEFAKKEVTVVLTGDGGDELFGGYDQYKFLLMAHKLRNLPYTVRARVIPFLVRHTPDIILNRIYPQSSATGSGIFTRLQKLLESIKDNPAKTYLEILSVMDDEERRQLFESTGLNIYDLAKEMNAPYFSSHIPFFQQLSHLDFDSYLPEDMLMKTDKMCMAFGVEARVPLLDKDVVGFGFSVPHYLKVNGFSTKIILKEAMKPHLPKEIIKRKKQTFQVPIHTWFSGEFKSFFEDLLSEDNLRQHNLLNQRVVEKIFDRYNQSRLYYARQIWLLGMFQTWYNIYITGEKPKGVPV